MTFLIQLTGPTEGDFRQRHAAVLRRCAHPAEVIAMGEDLFRVTVDPDQADVIRKALVDVEVWGAVIEES